MDKELQSMPAMADIDIPAPPAFTMFPPVRTGFVVIVQKPEGPAFYVHNDSFEADKLRRAFGMAAVPSQVVPASFMFQFETVAA